MRVIIGAGNTSQTGWLALQHQHLDIRQFAQWQSHFQLNSLDAVLSEHVLEHLDLSENDRAAQNVWRFLKVGGYWRIAVPDGFHPDQNYLNWVAPDSQGERWLSLFRAHDEPNHKVLWTYQTLGDFLSRRGFKVALREWFDENGQFHKANWNQEDGKIWRSAGTNWSNFLSNVVNAPYTSLLVDAIKVGS